MSRKGVPQGIPADGDEIRRYREDAGWSQQVLAERAGKSVDLINRIERGRHGLGEHIRWKHVQPSTLKAIADALGVDITQLRADRHLRGQRPNGQVA